MAALLLRFKASRQVNAYTSCSEGNNNMKGTLFLAVICALMISPATAAPPQPPIEIWLNKGIGRWGNYWFYALGGTNKHPTPKGTFTVKAKHKEFYSNKYDAPMPRSVFFTEQCAIHVGSLRTRSHGCIHVDWPTGQMIYDYSRTGKTKVKIYR